MSITWDIFNQVQCIRQTLINNGYSNSFVDQQIRRFMCNVESAQKQAPIAVRNLYFKNQMNNGYLQDEKVLRKIIHDNVKVIKPTDKLRLIIYYSSKKTFSLVMKNNLSQKKERTVAHCDVVYQFSCPAPQCFGANHGERHQYIGHTVCSLSRRLSMHLQNGAIKEHFEQKHGRKITRSEIVDNTVIRYIEHDFHRLVLLESLLIKFEKPTINLQDTGFKRVLSLFS